MQERISALPFDAKGVMIDPLRKIWVTESYDVSGIITRSQCWVPGFDLILQDRLNKIGFVFATLHRSEGKDS